MKRKLKVLSSIRRKKKNQSAVSPSDFNGIQVKAEEVKPSNEEQRDEPEQAPAVDPEELERYRKNLAIQEMLEKNAYLEKVAFSNKKMKPKEAEGGIFSCMCGTLEDACGEDFEEEECIFVRKYKIVKESPSEKVGLSFVAFKQQDGIFVCKIKEGSKFNATGLKVGMRVVAINDKPCPERVSELMKMLKEVEKELVLEVERMGNDPSENVDFMVPPEEARTLRVEVADRPNETEIREREESKPVEREVKHSNQRVEVRKPRLYNSDSGKVDDDDNSEEETGYDKYKSKFDSMKKRMGRMKKRGTVSFIPNRKYPYVVADDGDVIETESSGSQDNGTSPAFEENAQTGAPKDNAPHRIYDSDSSQSSGSFSTNESPPSRFSAIIDGLVGADKDRFQVKKGEGFTISEVTKKMQEGAPVWMFFE